MDDCFSSTLAGHVQPGAHPKREAVQEGRSQADEGQPEATRPDGFSWFQVSFTTIFLG